MKVKNLEAFDRLVTVARAQRVFAELVFTAAAIGIINAVTLEKVPNEVCAGDRRVFGFTWHSQNP